MYTAFYMWCNDMVRNCFTMDLNDQDYNYTTVAFECIIRLSSPEIDQEDPRLDLAQANSTKNK